MKKEFVMRGQTASGHYEILNFSGYKPGYAYRMTDFTIYPSAGIGSTNAELAVSITAAKLTTDDPPVSPADPSNPDFNQEGLIAVAMLGMRSDVQNGQFLDHTVINDTFLITQNLILSAIDTLAGSPMAVNWQCRFESIKMTGPEEAATNYKQYAISDE